MTIIQIAATGSLTGYAVAGAVLMISERDRDELRACMPDLLRERFGITDVRRSFRCPSSGHNDGDPSAHYYEDGYTVHCFGCGKTWDVFSLIAEADGVIGFAEQARAVARIVGYNLDESPDAGGRKAKPKPKPRKREPYDFPRPAGAQDCSEACGHAFGELYYPENDVGRRYLRWRGLDDADISRHGLGFTKDPRLIMPQFRVYEPEALGFITIPFWDRGFGEAHYCMVRTISRGTVRNKEWRPKGVSSPLWNEWMLSAALDVVYVAEGLIDAIVLRKVTGKPTMALGGVANAKRLAQVVYRTQREHRPKKLVVCMDEDVEGRKTRDKIISDLDRIGVAHAVIPPYPNGAKDADEWLMAGRGKEWVFEEHMSGPPGEFTLYRTRWRDGR